MAFSASAKWYVPTLQYRIVVQDGISIQGEDFAIVNKHTGSNKIVQAVFFVKKGLELPEFSVLER